MLVRCHGRIVLGLLKSQKSPENGRLQRKKTQKNMESENGRDKKSLETLNKAEGIAQTEKSSRATNIS